MTSIELFSAPVLIPASLVFIAAAFVWKPKRDSRNPPLVASPFPFFGHLFQFLYYGPEFWSRLREQTRLPIYSIFFVTQEIHVINDAKLIHLVHREASNKDRQARAISQRTMTVDTVFGKLFGLSKSEVDIIKTNIDGKMEGPYYRLEMHQMLARDLGPSSPIMAQIDRDTLLGVGREIGLMSRGGPACVDLLQWLHAAFLRAASVALYGPENPVIKRPEMVQDLWDFDQARSRISIGWFQSVLAPTALKARERGVEDFGRFLAKARTGWSELTNNIMALDEKYGFSEESHARFHFSMMTGTVSNTIPTIFWIVAAIVCDKSLHARILDELKEAIVRENGAGAKGPRLTMDVKAVRQKCALLCATCDETIRLRTAGSVALRVEKDYLLGERYLLNKEALILVPGAALLTDPSAWGPDADVFRPERFLDPRARANPAWAPFGGGYNICPARHLVKDQIIGAVAMLVFTFDLAHGDAAREGQGFRDVAGAGDNMSTTVPPAKPLDVRFTTRKGMEGVKWDIA